MQQTRKLFNKDLTQNNINTLKNSLNSNHKLSLFVCMGKFRLGKSTLLNIVISELKNLNTKTNFFKEECSNITVTDGADYYIYSDTNKKIDYVFIDCEGLGNFNNSQITKLCLLAGCISTTLILNIDKAYDDLTLNNFTGQFIAHMELLKLPIPQIHVVIRDAGQKSLKNYLGENKDANISIKDLKTRAQNKVHPNYSFKSYLKTNHIHFIATPLTTDDGVQTDDRSSQFFKDLQEFSKVLYKEIKYSSIESIKKVVDFLWSYDISKLNQNEYDSYVNLTINKAVNDIYSRVINEIPNTTTYQASINAYNSNVTKYEQLVTDSIKQKFPVYPSTAQNIIKNSVNTKMQPIKTRIDNEYQTSKTQYNTKRENTSKQDPVYKNESYQEPYTVYDYIHRGYVDSYCGNCSNLYNTNGCQNTGHTGTWRQYKKRFLGIKVKSWHEWNCCGNRNHGSYCPHSKNIHPSTVRKYNGCKCSEGSNGCTQNPRTAYRTSNRSVVSHYQKVYTISDWNESMFSFKFKN